MTEQRRIPLFDITGKRVYVVGHRGMVGAALVRRLKSERTCIPLNVENAVFRIPKRHDDDCYNGGRDHDRRERRLAR